MYRSSAPRNQLEQKVNTISSEASQPSYAQERISYGIISAVDNNTSQVKVTLLLDDGTPGEPLGNGFLPIINPLDQVYLNFGMLRENMRCRIYWRGRNYPPQTGLVEIIG